VRPQALGLLCLLAVSACGYGWVRYDTDPLSQERVVLDLLVNESFEPGVEFLVNDAFRREFMRRGALRLVDERDAADLVISGEVLPVSAQARSFSSVNFALEYEITLRLSLHVQRRGGEAVALDSTTLSASELYLASADVEAARKNRKEALRRVASLIAARVHDALIETSAP
jgi:hypothetical protein